MGSTYLVLLLSTSIGQSACFTYEDSNVTNFCGAFHSFACLQVGSGVTGRAVSTCTTLGPPFTSYTTVVKGTFGSGEIRGGVYMVCCINRSNIINAYQKMCIFLYALTHMHSHMCVLLLTSLHHVCIVQIQNPLDMKGNRGVTNVVVDLYYNTTVTLTVRAIMNATEFKKKQTTKLYSYNHSCNS